MFAAVSLSAQKPLVWTELEPQRLGSQDVRVAVQAVGVNPVDWKMREGGPLRMVQRLTGPSGALVVGVDFAGEVTEVGHGVAGIQIGDRVVGGTNFSVGQRGSYATEVVVRGVQITPLQPQTDVLQAGALPVAGVTAHQALTQLCHIDHKPGAKVLVLGASGGVGHMAVQIARLLGATVFGVCSSRNGDFVRGLGGEVLAYDTPDFAAQVRAAGPFDAVVDGVGSAAYPVQQARSWLAPGGRHVLVVPRPIDLPWLLTGKTTTVLGQPLGEGLRPLVQWLEAGQLRVQVARVFALQDAEAAHQLSQQGKVAGKLVLSYQP